jgi:hypothetical protein
MTFLSFFSRPRLNSFLGDEINSKKSKKVGHSGPTRGVTKFLVKMDKKLTKLPIFQGSKTP